MCHLCRAERRAEREYRRRNRYRPKSVLDVVLTLVVFGGIWGLFYLLIWLT
jgi:hypothetical protein